MNMHVWYTNLCYDIIDVVISSLNIWTPLIQIFVSYSYHSCLYRTISLDLYAFIVSQVSLVLPVCRQWSFIFVTHWRYSLPRPSSLYLSLSISRSLLCVSNYDSPCGISFSHTNTKLCLPGSHFSLLFPCVPLAHPSYRDVFRSLDMRTYDSSS